MEPSPGSLARAVAPTFIAAGLIERHVVNHSRISRFLLRTLATLLLALGISSSLAATAQADAYRYWSYWQGQSGTWVAAQTGPGGYQVVDGDVQGWRFAISTEAPATGPDNAPDFAGLCPALAASGPEAGSLRVAVVIDSGTAAEAPGSEVPPADTIACVTVPQGATGNQAIAAAASVREADGMVCALNGYPANECSAQISDSDATAALAAAASEEPNPADPAAVAGVEDQATDSGNGPGFVLLIAVVIAAVLGVGAWVGARGRRVRG